MMFRFDHGVSASRNGREVLIHGAHDHITYRLHGRAARYARRIMRRGIAKLPDDLETWDLVGLGVIVHDPDAEDTWRTRRTVSGGLFALAAVAIAAWVALDGSPAEMVCPLSVEQRPSPTDEAEVSPVATPGPATACLPMVWPMRPVG